LELNLIVSGLSKDRETAIEVPCFHCAASIKLGAWNLYAVVPEQGSAFPVVLERLSVIGFGKVHSSTIEDLDATCGSGG
jgi:hypothetical protein